jgi:cell division protein FtsI/penicillin-binding protein 2
VGAIGLVVVIVAGVAVWQLERGSRPSAAVAAAGLASTLERGQLATVPFANAESGEAAATWAAIRVGMREATPSVGVTRTEVHGDAATVSLAWSWRLPLEKHWAYRTSATLRYVHGAWRAVWSPGLVHPSLGPGSALELSVRQPLRAPILATGGQPIVEPRPVVNVGIEPKRVRNLKRLVRRLHVLLGVREQPLLSAVRAAAPLSFVPVITLRRAQYEALRDKIYPLPGTVFTSGTLPLAPTHAFARSLLGTTGEATAEVVAGSHGRIRPGEIVGLSGLELAYDDRLGGRPGLVVRSVGRQGHATTLFETATRPGAPLRTTLEPRVQEAADAALAGVKQPSALVAIRISTGDLIAVSVGPDPGEYDIALQGQYPPGSTFKLATTLALLARGLQPMETVDCPALLTVDGKVFHNAEQEVLGPAPFSQDFARSCNTAFASLAPRVPGPALPAAARALGIGIQPSLGVPAFGGSVPTPAGPVELAADAFGQGRVLVSPFAMAGAAAAIARGRWQAPRLVLDSARPAVGPLLPAGAVATLRSLMREVVTSGTGTLLAVQPGPPVYGKTGTAEIGAQTPPRTDAWFVGYQGDIAFAALVANTHNGFGGTVAAPVVSRFLGRLHAAPGG